MTPFFFGSGERRLFGVYSAAHAAAVSRASRAVVLCHPWGSEYQYAHRSMRHLANMLNAAGIHVLRFDYFGTGDSAGEAREARVADWRGDIETAVEELKDTTGLTRVGLVGLRLGATIAAQVAAKARDTVDRLVLWDPVVKGETYLAELRQAPTLRDGRGIGGFPLSDEFAKDLVGADLLTSIANFPGAALVIASSRGAFDERLRSPARLASSGTLTFELIEGPPVWLPEHALGVGAIPAELVRRIVDWLRL
jgi:uncharacterized protein